MYPRLRHTHKRLSALPIIASRPIARPKLWSGFTLVELLVVISIIALLIAILLPALQAARTVAHRTVSVSNARQITFALHVYAHDHNGSMPFLRDATEDDPGQWSGSNPYWTEVLFNHDYVVDWHVYRSPGRVRTEFSTSWRDWGRPSYGLSVGVASEREDYENGSRPPSMRIDQGNAPPPSEMIMLAETFRRTTGGANSFEFDISGQYDARPIANNSRLFNYNGGIVRSYMDGRANAHAAERGVRVSNRIGHAGDPANPPPHHDRLGWDLNEGDTTEGPYAGFWHFLGSGGGYQATHEYNAPWFTEWQTIGWGIGQE